jgi:hypothetical protein
MEEAMMNEYATKARQKWDDYGATQRRIGREEGLTIGESRVLQVAQSLIARGQAPEFVSEITGIPIKDLEGATAHDQPGWRSAASAVVVR